MCRKCELALERIAWLKEETEYAHERTEERSFEQGYGAGLVAALEHIDSVLRCDLSIEFER